MQKVLSPSRFPVAVPENHGGRICADPCDFRPLPLARLRCFRRWRRSARFPVAVPENHGGRICADPCDFRPLPLARLRCFRRWRRSARSPLFQKTPKTFSGVFENGLVLCSEWGFFYDRPKRRSIHAALVRQFMRKAQFTRAPRANHLLPSPPPHPENSIDKRAGI